MLERAGGADHADASNVLAELADSARWRPIAQHRMRDRTSTSGCGVSFGYGADALDF